MKRLISIPLKVIGFIILGIIAFLVGANMAKKPADGGTQMTVT